MEVDTGINIHHSTGLEAFLKNIDLSLVLTLLFGMFRFLAIGLFIVYICKLFLLISMKLICIIVTLFCCRGSSSKGRRRQSGVSCLNNFFSTGDVAKDMLTLRNTIMNSKT